MGRTQKITCDCSPGFPQHVLQTHNGFPVYVRDDDPESGEALGECAGKEHGAQLAAASSLRSCMNPHLPLRPCAGNDEPTSTRLEGLILRSQLLVLLQRRHFCDSHGHPVGRDPNPQ